MENREISNCVGCSYYYITWDKQFPKGCKYFGFKSSKMPCMVVKESSGEWCNLFTPKQSKEKE